LGDAEEQNSYIAEKKRPGSIMGYYTCYVAKGR
jgi:hypothetical protein